MWKWDFFKHCDLLKRPHHNNFNQKNRSVEKWDEKSDIDSGNWPIIGEFLCLAAKSFTSVPTLGSRFITDRTGFEVEKIVKNCGLSSSVWNVFEWVFMYSFRRHSVWKSPKMSHFWILAFSTNFWPIKTDLSGNTVWPQASGFQKLAKMDTFLAFLSNFCTLKM